MENIKRQIMTDALTLMIIIFFVAWPERAGISQVVDSVRVTDTIKNKPKPLQIKSVIDEKNQLLSELKAQVSEAALRKRRGVKVVYITDTVYIYDTVYMWNGASINASLDSLKAKLKQPIPIHVKPHKKRNLFQRIFN